MRFPVHAVIKVRSRSHPVSHAFADVELSGTAETIVECVWVRDLACVSESTPWLHTGSTIAPYTFHLAPKVVPAAKHFVWMLSVGVEFGFPITAYDIAPTVAQAAGKVLRVVSGGGTGFKV